VWLVGGNIPQRQSHPKRQVKVVTRHRRRIPAGDRVELFEVGGGRAIT